MKSAAPEVSALASLDRVVHEPARTMILAVLYSVESADFIFLMNQTQLSWGNLSSHMSKLEEAGYIEVQKDFVDRKPRTWMRITATGRQAFESYARIITTILSSV